MHDLDVTGQLASVAHTVKTTSDVHQAGLVCAAENVAPLSMTVCAFFSNDLLRNVRLFDGERAAETAATVSHFSISTYSRPCTLLQENQRWFLNAEQTGSVAGFVECDPFVQGRTNIGHAKDIDDEIGEFVETVCNTLCADRPLWFVSKDLHVLVLHCESAGAGEADDGLCIFKRFDRDF